MLILLGRFYRGKWLNLPRTPLHYTTSCIKSENFWYKHFMYYMHLFMSIKLIIFHYYSFYPEINPLSLKKTFLRLCMHCQLSEYFRNCPKTTCCFYISNDRNRSKNEVIETRLPHITSVVYPAINFKSFSRKSELLAYSTSNRRAR